MAIESDSSQETSEFNVYDLGGELGSPNGHFGGTISTEQLFDLLQLERNKDLKILEVGCGAGHTSCYYAKKLGCHITGIDISEQMINSAKKRAKSQKLSNVDFRVASALDLPFEDNTFDVVIAESCTGVLPDRPRALQEYYRVLKPGGIFGDIDGFIVADAPPEIYEQICDLMGKTLSANVKIPTLDDWKSLFEGIPLNDTQLITSHENVLHFRTLRALRQAYGTFGFIKLIIKMLYYIVVIKEFRVWLKEMTQVTKTVFAKDGKNYRYMGYVIFKGKK
ncbi:MAG: class I SAM-dependent methyltransferase [Candidatus Hermodarchaeota archaeon]